MNTVIGGARIKDTEREKEEEGERKNRVSSWKRNRRNNAK